MGREGEGKMKKNDYWQRLHDEIKDKVNKGNIEEAKRVVSKVIYDAIMDGVEEVLLHDVYSELVKENFFGGNKSVVLKVFRIIAIDVLYELVFKGRVLDSYISYFVEDVLNGKFNVYSVREYVYYEVQNRMIRRMMTAVDSVKMFNEFFGYIVQDKVKVK